MEIRHLRYFVSVAENMSFTKAAAQHYVAQSALSQQISRLESELGSALFYRSTRAVTLTEAGEVLLPLAQRIIADAENAKMEMEALTGLRRGTLRLGLIQAPATSIDMLGVMGEFHDRYPGIRFQVTEGTTTEMVEAVAGGGLDVALVGLAAAEAPPGVRCVELGSEPLVAIVSAKHPLAGRRRIALTELAEDEQFIHFRDGSGLRRRVEDAFARAGLNPAVTFEMGLITDMVELAARNVGVTVVPSTALTRAGEINGVRFAAIALNDDQARHPVSIVYNPARLSSAAEAFTSEFARRANGSAQLITDS
ncbi:LysR family transcriptional regulator [Actinospica sp.]|jgi:DNA-binding transcriptional LysR family regulator|uniref:LysR family transcriptional regulator n=1 Tax=Actinospica sp. TaxID=1872142 RepID=UPI002D0C1F9C|nr:LysR family transcriptional regulator [Actinospica sp.]HWG27564.1 LysR family transcriptional regulator [Actinospica sp.]